MSFELIFYIVAAVCFGASVVVSPPRANLIALGLCFWVLVPLIHAL